MFLIVHRRNMRVVGDEDDVGIVQCIVPAIFVEHLPYRTIGHVREISHLGIQRILGGVGEYVDPRKVHNLQIGYAVFVDRLVQLLD